jgi:hypothetical protein
MSWLPGFGKVRWFAAPSKRNSGSGITGVADVAQALAPIDL